MKAEVRYNLNLTEDYVKHWTVEHSLRELVANTIDEDGTITHEDGNIVFTTPNYIPLEAWLMGYSVKSKDNPIGQYGEGLKLAMLVLARERVDFSIFTGATEIGFMFDYPLASNGEIVFGVKTLHLEVRGLSPEDTLSNTVITVYDRKIRELYAIYTEAPTGIIANSSGLYCQGLLVSKDFYIKNNSISYGVNLDKPVKLNRDRTSYEALADIAHELEVLDPGFFAGEFYSNHALSSIISEFSPEYKQRIAKAWANINTQHLPSAIESNRVVFGDGSKTYANTKGLLVVRYWYYGWTYLNTYEDRELLRQQEIIFSSDEELRETTTPSKTDDAKKRRYELLLGEVALTESLPDLLETLVKYIPITKAQRERAHRVIRLRLESGFGQPQPVGEE